MLKTGAQLCIISLLTEESSPKIIICDGENHSCVKLESKDYMEYLGGIIEKNLSRKFHIDATPTKISKTVGLITKLCNFSPRRTSLYSNLT